jgi:quinoprotein glucose dehydrogenase
VDARVRDLATATGKELWKRNVMAPTVPMPAIYTYEDRQYVVFTVGGNPILKSQVGDQIIAFALPE